MNKLQVYGDRFFEAEGKEGGDPTKAPAVDNELQAKLDRLAHLEKENKELIASRDKAKESKRKEEEEKLKQQGELQKILDTKEKEIELLKPKADAFEQLRLDEIEEAKKSLGAKWIDEYELLPLSALRKTVQMIEAKPKAVGTDNGRMDDLPSVTLSPEQKKDAYEKFPNLSKEKAEEYWYDVLVKTGKIKKG